MAENFLRGLTSQSEKQEALVVGLSGDLGSGKTAFVKCIAEVLGVPDVVTSPTFILEKIYSIPTESILGNQFTKMIHIDAYRLEAGYEMSPLGWDAILKDKHNLILLEWPEKVSSAMPKDINMLSFKYVDEGVRCITGLTN